MNDPIVTSTSIHFNERRPLTVRVECIPTPALLERLVALGGLRELTIEAPAPESASGWDVGAQVLRAVADGTLQPSRVELEVRPDERRVDAPVGRYSRGDHVVVRWVDGWNLPREADGRPATVTIDHEQPRRVGVKIQGLRWSGWWGPAVSAAPCGRSAALPLGGDQARRTMETASMTKPITIKLHMHGTRARILHEEKAFRGRVVAAGPCRITVEIEIDDDHYLRKGVPVLLVRDGDRELDEHAARLTEEDVARFRAYLRTSEGRKRSGGVLTRDILKRRAKLLRGKAAG